MKRFSYVVSESFSELCPSAVYRESLSDQRGYELENPKCWRCHLCLLIAKCTWENAGQRTNEWGRSQPLMTWGFNPFLTFKETQKLGGMPLCSEKKATDMGKDSSACASERSTGQKRCSATEGFFKEMNPVTAGSTQHPKRGEEILRKSLSV